MRGTSAPQRLSGRIRQEIAHRLGAFGREINARWQIVFRRHEDVAGFDGVADIRTIVGGFIQQQ
jgi:hypothetical protein